ncbi:MAG: PA2169 family four-helix-bundle protein [Dyadobacter sp.]|uniref:PA2169 family four-helix-bundle protein n=1 Tax=Dyadobacter sp. TaxID=1914288 RepID=UPI001B0D8C95|nr:PA2169 family four-helix-bundle protein [Dyadobacter sp.]MBO9612748.1 PA2169 family four-helix-bundle protein [Dyadobacter sp.]
MARNSETIEILNDLILINNDRIAGYEKAEAEAGELENDLRAMFNSLAGESRTHVRDLKSRIMQLGGEPATGTLLSGKLYRIWMDIRATFTSDNRRAVLENAEAGEDAAKKAYEEALQSNELPAEIYQLVQHQYNAVQAAHNNIKTERDRQRDVSKYPLTT